MMEHDGTQPVILVVEDDPAHSEAMSRVLERHGGWQLRFASSLAEAQRAIAEREPALVLADLNLADGKAFELLSRPGEEARLPVLLLTSHGDEQSAVRAMRGGALDYLVKSAEAFGELPRSVERALREWHLIESRRSAELALRDSEERFRVLFESSPDACYIGAADGTYIDVNHAAEEMLGYRREELVGKSPRDMGQVHPDYRAAARNMMTQCRPGVPSPPTELVIVRRDGQEIVVEARVVPVRIGGGMAILSTSRDITARRRADADRARLEEQLRQASKMEAVGRLAGGVAHDFNNLLTGIRGFTDILLEGAPADGAARSDLLEIQRATERAAGLTAQLLAFSRKRVVEPVLVDVNEQLSNAQRILERLIGEDVHVTFEPGAELPSVLIDPSAMEQVLMNLAVNARDAMPSGGTLRIATSKASVDAEFCQAQLDARPGDYVVLSVSDTGVGMAQSVLSRLFEPFFTTKGPGQGTGLGLSIIYGIVQQCGGFVHVESQVGVGATFSVYLPASEGRPQATEARKFSELPRGKETILLVEDEVLVRSLVTKFLSNEGYRVLSASRGSEALQLAAEADGVDLLVSDVILPSMNGRQIYEQLVQTRPGLRVLFMSGYTENIIAPHGVLEAGFYFVQKPFSLQDLARKVREALDGQGA